jgi:hypothetical protein
METTPTPYTKEPPITHAPDNTIVQTEANKYLKFISGKPLLLLMPKETSLSSSAVEAKKKRVICSFSAYAHKNQNTNLDTHFTIK